MPMSYFFNFLGLLSWFFLLITVTQSTQKGTPTLTCYMQRDLTSHIRLSFGCNDDDTEKNILLINKIGILKNIYKYCSIAYVGGGFGKGIHNTLEVASNNIPVIFGPNYKKFNEAHFFLDFLINFFRNIVLKYF